MEMVTVTLPIIQKGAIAARRTRTVNVEIGPDVSDNLYAAGRIVTAQTLLTRVSFRHKKPRLVEHIHVVSDICTSCKAQLTQTLPQHYC